MEIRRLETSRGYGNTLLLDGKGFSPALKQSVRMRLSTAVALALTVLLAVSAIGSVVVPAAASSSADSESPLSLRPTPPVMLLLLRFREIPLITSLNLPIHGKKLDLTSPMTVTFAGR